VQNLRPRRAHAGALAGREHDCKASLVHSSINHVRNYRIRVPRLVLSEAAGVEKAGWPAKFVRSPSQDDGNLVGFFAD
jgi:hypothetical protein